MGHFFLLFLSFVPSVGHADVAGVRFEIDGFCERILYPRLVKAVALESDKKHYRFKRLIDLHPVDRRWLEHIFDVNLGGLLFSPKAYFLIGRTEYKAIGYLGKGQAGDGPRAYLIETPHGLAQAKVFPHRTAFKDFLVQHRKSIFRKYFATILASDPYSSIVIQEFRPSVPLDAIYTDRINLGLPDSIMTDLNPKLALWLNALYREITPKEKYIEPTDLSYSFSTGQFLVDEFSRGQPNEGRPFFLSPVK